jgi:O-antigen ligase
VAGEFCFSILSLRFSSFEIRLSDFCIRLFHFPVSFFAFPFSNFQFLISNCRQHVSQPPSPQSDSMYHNLLAPNRAASWPKLRSSTWLGLFLWLLLWGGYSTGDWLLRDPRFPSSTMNLIHGVRSLFPLVAGWLGVLVILIRNVSSRGALESPLGLMVIFTVMGTISSALLSLDPIAGLYWAASFGSVLAVTLALMVSEDPLESLSWVHYLNVVICAVFVLSVMVSLPYLRDLGGEPLGSAPFQLKPGRFIAQPILEMYGTRSTGLARYAAVLGLATLARLLEGKKGSLRKLVWVALLVVSLYILYRAQGRTAIAGFVVGAWVILWSQRAGRWILLPAAVFSAAILYLLGFQSALWSYFNQGRQFDPTMTGRVATWHEGWELLRHSPWIGVGFQGDRIFLAGKHMHDGLLEALVQAGGLGGVLWLGALLLTWVLVFRLYRRRAPAYPLALPLDVPGILAFLTVGSFAESNFAYFSAAWLIGAPLLAYVQCLAMQRGLLPRLAKSARQARPRFAQPIPAARGPGKA